MQIENDFSQFANPQLEQLLKSAQIQGTDLVENLLKMNAQQQVDQKQMGYIGTIIDLYA